VTLDFKHASVIEGARFSSQIAIPGVIQGLFKKRTVPARAAKVLNAERQAYRLVAGMVKKYGPDPFYVRVVAEEALLVHHPEDLEFVLGQSPSPFASDPDAKRKGMTAFQPDALTISRGDVWEHRRKFAEAVLDTKKPLHRLAKPFLAVAVEEADALVRLGEARPMAWDDINSAFQRLTRRAVFGDHAADDWRVTEQLGTLMAAGNRMPGKPAKGYDDFVAHIERYVDQAHEGSLCSLIARAPKTDARPAAGQLIHWLFAMGDTLPANVFRTLALLATHPEQMGEARASLEGVDLMQPKAVAGLDYLGGCIQDAMRLYPTTALFGRVTTEDVHWPNGVPVKAGTQVLIYNPFNHRNRDRVKYADTFAPGQWVSGQARSDWSFNFFSNGPQGCPGAGLAIFLGQAVLARILTESDPVVKSGAVNPNKPLPYNIDQFGLKISLPSD